MAICKQSSPSRPACPQQKLIRLVLPCGTLRNLTLNGAMSAREALQLTLSNLSETSDKTFNNYLICDSASLRIGKRPCPVHPDMPLELGHLYYVLPIRTCQHRLTWSHISALAEMATPLSNASAVTTLPSSATKKTHASVSHYNKPSPSKISKRYVVSCTFSCIPFGLSFLLYRSLLSKGLSRVNDAHTASRQRYSTGVSMPRLALDTEGKGDKDDVGAAELMRSKARETAWKFNNICESSEANSKYVELLIERSYSWRPPLHTIQESHTV